MAALLDILHSLEVVIKDKEQAAVAYRRVCNFFAPSVNQPAASEWFELELTLGLLMDLIKTEDEAKLAMSCIAEKLKSLAAGSATSQEGDTSQHVTSSSSPSSSAQVATSSLSAEAEPTTTTESEVPESPSTDSAVSTVTKSQQSSASTEDTTPPPPVKTELIAPVKPKVYRPSSAITAPADQKPAASAQSTTSPPSVESKSTSAATSQVPKSSSTTTALSDISQSQKPSASARSATSAPSVEAESNAPIKSKVSPVAAPADQQHSASGQKASSPPSKKAESPAPAQSVVFNPSSTNATLANVAQSQQPSAPIAPPVPFKPAGAPNIPNTTQSQQPVTPAMAPQSSSAKPNRPLYSADELIPSSYSLRPTYSPDRGAPLDYELAVRVGTYSSSSTAVISKLVEHGGRKHDPPLKQRRSVPKAEKLFYLDFFKNERKMLVQRDKFKDHNGYTVNIPHVSCNQYLDLYNSMMHYNPSDLDATCRKILAELEIAIVNRAAVYKWYESLPPTDGRVAFNPRHLALLQMFEKLESAINRYLHTGRRQIIRR